MNNRIVHAGSVLLFFIVLEACGGIILVGDGGEDDLTTNEQFVMTWAKSYGGQEVEKSYSIEQTSDGGYIVLGNTKSFGLGSNNFWILKLTAAGDIEWQKTYGGSSLNETYTMDQTSDGGYIVAGGTTSFGVGYRDFWILKLNAFGDIVWQKTYGGTDDDLPYSIQQTIDEGYVVAGTTMSFGASNYDTWVVKLDPLGDIVWQKIYGSTENDISSFMQQTSDEGYIVAGVTDSFSEGEDDVWVLKLDAYGDVVWQKTYGGTGGDIATSIQSTLDEGYIVTAFTMSFGAGSFDAWILKLNSSGDVEWQKTYGEADSDIAHFVQQTPDDGYIVAGYFSSFSSVLSNFWILKLNMYGNVEWEKIYGGSDSDEAQYIYNTFDGGFIVTGWTGSFGAGGADFWILKLDEIGNISDTCPVDIDGSSSAIVTDTFITPKNISILPVESNATLTQTNVRPFDTFAITETQCSR